MVYCELLFCIFCFLKSGVLTRRGRSHTQVRSGEILIDWIRPVIGQWKEKAKLKGLEREKRKKKDRQDKRMEEDGGR